MPRGARAMRWWCSCSWATATVALSTAIPRLDGRSRHGSRNVQDSEIARCGNVCNGYRCGHHILCYSNLKLSCLHHANDGPRTSGARLALLLRHQPTLPPATVHL
ncbi:hypothetical protein C8R46DRAFT_139905 [Mycena filopes]|nr:hypothetical protein C8R46DRAFT_139905 [Mycena filopes]